MTEKQLHLTNICRSIGDAPHCLAIVNLIPLHEAPLHPPTFFKLNQVSQVYQNLISSYGIPRYQELNPAVFTMVTFPFLFGIMYGDIGHGMCLFLFACYLICHDKMKNIKRGEISEMIYQGRFVLLGMAFFSIYCGFI